MKDTEVTLNEFLEEAYWLQRGEFYPQTHLSNIQKLCRKYPWERHVVDALYRILPHFDDLMEEVGKRVIAGELTKDEGFEKLDLPVFYYISLTLKREAWELHLDNQCLP